MKLNPGRIMPDKTYFSVQHLIQLWNFVPQNEVLLSACLASKKGCVCVGGLDQFMTLMGISSLDCNVTVSEGPVSLLMQLFVHYEIDCWTVYCLMSFLCHLMFLCHLNCNILIGLIVHNSY